MADRGTTEKTGNRFMNVSRKVSPSSKTKIPTPPIFGGSSQFKGVGTGERGDVRK